MIGHGLISVKGLSIRSLVYSKVSLGRMTTTEYIWYKQMRESVQVLYCTAKDFCLG
jgi:hypothetical protein